MHIFLFCMMKTKTNELLFSKRKQNLICLNFPKCILFNSAFEAARWSRKLQLPYMATSSQNAVQPVLMSSMVH